MLDTSSGFSYHSKPSCFEFMKKPPFLTASTVLFFAASHLTAADPVKPAPTAARAIDIYLTKEYVDSVIQEALYLFNAAAGDGALLTQQKAIEDARAVSAALSRQARNDPNKRYVLWRVSELEHQIFLEQQEIDQKQRLQRQAAVNAIVDQFNPEVGKRRPDFTLLERLLQQMEPVDPDKAGQIELAIADRRRAIGRESLLAVEKALIAGDILSAQKELEYIDRHNAALRLAPDRLVRIRQQIQSRLDVDRVRQLIDEYFSHLDRDLALPACYAARFALQGIDFHLASVKPLMERSDWSRLASRADAGRARVEAIEDSLVTANLAILHDRGIDPAIDFLERRIRPAQLPLDKVARIDEAIRATPLNKTDQTDERIHDELSALTGMDADDGVLSMASVHKAVQARAQARADSIRLFEEQQARIQEKILAKERAFQQREQEKKEQLALREARRKEKEEQRLQKQAAATRERSGARPVSPPVASPVAASQSATDSMLHIYTLLEAGQTVPATQAFNRQREKLREQLSPDLFEMLLATVNETRQQVSIPASSGSEIVLVSRQPLASTAVQADAELSRNQEIARQKTTQIYRHLEDNQIVPAYTLFQKFEKPLRKYLSGDVYEMLSMTVTQAWADHQRQAGGR